MTELRQTGKPAPVPVASQQQKAIRIMIRAKQLTRQFEQKGRRNAPVDAVTTVDFSVEAGELIGFLGPNGAGKTTTLRMLTTLLRPTSGEATVAGCDLLTDPGGVRKRIGYVAQGHGTSPESTVAEELAFQGGLHRLTKKAARQRAAELAGELGLAGLERRLTRTLSGGQRRRLDLAMGLIHKPNLVFLDEPTTGLDPQSRANLWDHIRRLRAEKGTTIFLTTHYLNEADELCDRILVMDGGRLIAEGAPHSLKAQVAGDSVTVGVTAEGVAATREAVQRIADAYDVSASRDQVHFRVPHAHRVLPGLLRALDAAAVTTTSLLVSRPTLDDVFLHLTGRTLQDGGGPVFTTEEADARAAV
ncbi:ABC transporter ATP-binding protein [Streptomyces sp. NPDC006654]|uniref:ABC transporter ATP-binding protein n=1 Tax=Streptomyces sp. NPDC006654 TaxID=3156897 RepID=UPI0033D4CC92